MILLFFSSVFYLSHPFAANPSLSPWHQKWKKKLGETIRERIKWRVREIEILAYLKKEKNQQKRSWKSRNAIILKTKKKMQQDQRWWRRHNKIELWRWRRRCDATPHSRKVGSGWNRSLWVATAKRSLKKLKRILLELD